MYSAIELQQWYAYYLNRPYGPWNQTVMAAKQAVLAGNAFGGKIEIQDVLPAFGHDPESLMDQPREIEADSVESGVARLLGGASVQFINRDK